MNWPKLDYVRRVGSDQISVRPVQLIIPTNIKLKQPRIRLLSQTSNSNNQGSDYFHKQQIQIAMDMTNLTSHNDIV